MLESTQFLGPQRIQVLLADDHALIRTGIRTVLNIEPDIVLVGEATNGYEVRQLAQILQPDVILLDLNMPGPAPVDTVTLLQEKCPNTKLVILTAYDDDAYVRGMVGAGVAGYILKDEAVEVVVRAIRVILQGGTWYSRTVMEKLAYIPYGKMRGQKLTSRERQLLVMIAQGWSNMQIAGELQLAEQTVRNYASRLYSKIEVHSRAQAIVWARENYMIGEM
jgi:DNA-binding NarL/FixJ family response regulator